MYQYGNYHNWTLSAVDGVQHLLIKCCLFREEYQSILCGESYHVMLVKSYENDYMMRNELIDYS